jgi:DNA-binding GntR family transcriptional regulator
LSVRPLPAPSAVNDALADLRGQIANGQLRPGDSVAEEDVARRLGISRTPVREAIGRLVSEGLLTKDDNRTARVFRPSLEDLLEIYEIRLPLEILAATLAAENADETLDKSLRDCFGRLRDRPVDQAWTMNHEEFHLTLFSGSKRGHLLEVIAGLRLRSEPYVRFAIRVDSKFRERSQTHHAAMIKAVAARDPKQMERLVRRHLKSTTDKVTELLNEGLWVPSIQAGPAASDRPLR